MCGMNVPGDCPWLLYIQNKSHRLMFLRSRGFFACCIYSHPSWLLHLMESSHTCIPVWHLIKSESPLDDRINFLTKKVSDIRLRIYVCPLIDSTVWACWGKGDATCKTPAGKTFSGPALNLLHCSTSGRQQAPACRFYLLCADNWIELNWLICNPD